MKKKMQIYSYSIKMSEPTLKFNKIVANKKIFMILKKQLF